MRKPSFDLNNRNSELICLGIILLVAITTRLYELGTIPSGLYYDEITSVYHPYLYFHGELNLSPLSVLVSFFSGSSFIYGSMGASAFWTRFPSVVFGVLLTVLCWAFGKMLLGVRGGLISGFLAAFAPWAFHFSRYGVSILMSYVFYITLAAYLLALYFKTKKEKYKFCAFIVVGISLYTHAMALFFNLLFFPVFFVVGGILNKTPTRKILVDSSIFLVTVAIIALPFLFSYLSPGQPFSFTGRTTIAQSDSVLSLISNVITRVYMHLSPDFLFISGGKSFALNSGGFGTVITPVSLYYYDTAGQFGMLNIYGLFFYAGFLWLFYEIVMSKKVQLSSFLLIWWILSYALVSGFAFYDNPNSARNIEGLPAFLLIISLVIDKLWAFLFGSSKLRVMGGVIRKRLLGKTLKVMFLMALILPSVFYISTYFTTFGHSYEYFDYDYKLLSDYLTSKNLWNNPIILNEDRPDKWYGPTVLSFYNDSASKNIVIGGVATAFPFLASNTEVIYIIRDTQNITALSSAVSSTFLGIISYPDRTPVFGVWKLTALKGRTIIADDSASLWAPIHGTISGTRGSTFVYDENSIVKSGNTSLKFVITSGLWDWSGVRRDFEQTQNWSDAGALSFQLYGNDSKITIQLITNCEGGGFYHSFVDDFEGWHTFTVPFSDMQKVANPLIDHVD